METHFVYIVYIYKNNDIYKKKLYIYIYIYIYIYCIRMYAVWTLPRSSLDKKKFRSRLTSERMKRKKKRVKEKMKEIRVKEMKKWGERNDDTIYYHRINRYRVNIV